MQIVKSTQESQLKGCTDAQLLSIIRENDPNSQVAKSAFNEFFSRYKNYLYTVCLSVCRQFAHKTELAWDVFQNSMIKIFPALRKFSLDPSHTTAEHTKAVQAWVSRVANHEFKELLRKHPAEKALGYKVRFSAEDYDPGDLMKHHDEEEEEIEDTSISKLKLESALAQLSERERHILYIYAEHSGLKNPKNHLPDAEMQKLCEAYDTTSDNIRQIKHRALLKLEKLTKE